MVQIIINNGEKILEADTEKNLLENLSANDIVLPSACGGRGLCGMCKVQVKNGGSAPTEKEEKKLSAEQLGNSWRLACQTSFTTDISIELPGQLIGSTTYDCIVEDIADLTYDIKGVRFRLPEGVDVKYQAGQYMQITAPAYGNLKRSTYRAYSIASNPEEKGYLDFCIRRVPKGIVTTYVHDHMKVGDTVTLSGPYGDFYLRDSSKDIIFIAGGSGLSPVQSMVYEMIAKGIDNRKANFFFGACTYNDLFYVDKFRTLENEHPWFKYIPALSNEDITGDDCESGLITEVVDRYYSDLSNCQAYLCGSPGMINACHQVLENKGMDKSEIFYDKFA